MQDLPIVHKAFLWVGLVMDLVSKGAQQPNLGADHINSRPQQACIVGQRVPGFLHAWSAACSRVCKAFQALRVTLSTIMVLPLQARCSFRSSAWRGTACG